MSFKGTLTDQGKDMRRDTGGIAGRDLEVRQVIGGHEPRKRRYDWQIAEPRIFAEHGEKGVNHAARKSFAKHDAVDVTRVEVFGRGFDAQGADDAHTLAERNRKGGIGAGTADQKI